MPLEANAKGTVMMGLKCNSKDYKDITSKGVKVLYAIGEVPIKRPDSTEFLIVQHSHLNELGKEADILLPTTTSYEMQGTVIDYQGNLKRLQKAIEPLEDVMTNREIFKNLADKMNVPLKVADTSDVIKIIEGIKLEFKNKEISKRTDLIYKPKDLISSINKTMIEGSRLFWLKEIEKITMNV